MGYQNLQLNATDYTMVAPTFATVANADNQFSLRDIKVQPKAGTKFTWLVNKWTGGIDPAKFVVKLLNSDGSAKATYNWKYERVGTKDDYTENACWCKLVENKYVELTTDELDAKIDAGTGFWISGAGHALAPAGRVDEREIEFPMSATDYTATGNGTPVDLTLGDLTVTPKAGTKFTWLVNKWTGGIDPAKFVVKLLNSDGSAKATYNWKYERVGTKDDYTENACWCKLVENKYVELEQDELDSIEIPAGQGLWISGAGHTLNIPAPEL